MNPSPRLSVKISFGLFFVAVSILILEGFSRIYWSTKMDRTPLHLNEIYYYYYPELEATRPSPQTKDILLLGGSVLHAAAKRLDETFKSRFGPLVRIHDVSVPAHSSRDSLIKYRFLKNRNFDAVIYYHAINEVRANNIPTKSFRKDYGHYSWYAQVNALESSAHLPFLISPFLLRLTYLSAAVKFNWIDHIPPHNPRKEFLKYGHNILSRESFRDNLKATLDLAQQKKEPLLLLTFAYYLPPNYTLKRFSNFQLDYTKIRRRFATEIWGKPKNVISGIEAHNEVIRSFRDQARFLDMESRIRKNGSNFGDICHFSPEGKQHFADEIALSLNDILDR